MNTKKRIFVCFDLQNDAEQLDFVKEQAKRQDSPFAVVDYSEKWIPPEKDWIEKLKKKMQYIDLILVVTGQNSYRARNVVEEVEIAYKLGKPIIQTCGTKFSEYKPVPKAGKLLRWNWEFLKNILSK